MTILTNVFSGRGLFSGFQGRFFRYGKGKGSVNEQVSRRGIGLQGLIKTGSCQLLSTDLAMEGSYESFE